VKKVKVEVKKMRCNGYETPCCKKSLPEWEQAEEYKGKNGEKYPKIISHNKKIGDTAIANFNGEYSTYDWTEIHYCNQCNVEYDFLNGYP